MTSLRPLLGRLSAAGPLAPDIARGLRAAIATLVPFYFARELGNRDLVWVALGGWLGTLADHGGARLARAKTLAVFAIVGAITVAVCRAAAGSFGLGVGILAAIAFAGSIMRAVGATASGTGTLVVVVAAISVGTPPGDTVRDAVAFAIGAGWAVVLSSIVWPVWTHLPLRVAIAKAYRALSDYAFALEDATARGLPQHDAAWIDIARTYPRKARTAIEEARSMALATRARRSGETVLGSNLRTLLGSTEVLLPLVVALGVELESTSPDDRSASTTATLREIAVTHAGVAEAVGRTVIRSEPRDSLELEAPQSETGAARADVLARRLLAHTVAMANIAFALSSAPAAPPSQHGLRAEARRALAEDLRVLRDALSLRSTFFRHAVRVTLAVIAAQLAGQILTIDHAQWVTVTTIAVLQPYPGATMTRAIERVVGTVLGSLVAVAITFTIHDPLALAALMLPLSVAGIATRPRSHRLFTFFITPVFVLLAERWHGDWWVAAARAGDAFLGGTIALVAALVFPSREEKRLSAALQAMVQSVRSYAEIVVAAQLDAKPASPGVIAARREVGIALGSAETSLERLIAEPLRSRTEAQDAMLLVTHARRLVATFTTLDAHRIPAANAALLRVVLAHVLFSLDGGRGAGTVTTVPDLSTASPPWVRDALARIIRQSELVGVSLAATLAPERDASPAAGWAPSELRQSSTRPR